MIAAIIAVACLLTTLTVLGIGLNRAAGREMPSPPERCACGSWHPKIQDPSQMPLDPFKEGPER